MFFFDILSALLFQIKDHKIESNFLKFCYIILYNIILYYLNLQELFTHIPLFGKDTEGVFGLFSEMKQ